MNPQAVAPKWSSNSFQYVSFVSLYPVRLDCLLCVLQLRQDASDISELLNSKETEVLATNQASVVCTRNPHRRDAAHPASVSLRAFVPQLRRALAAQTELRAQLRSSEERWALRESELQLSMSRAQQVRPSTFGRCCRSLAHTVAPT